MNVLVVQLPFPSMTVPHAAVASYYRDYSARFSELVSGYFLPEDGLWEMPLWVAHLLGMLRAIDRPAGFADLSSVQSSPDVCLDILLERTAPGSIVMLSPLAQNFDLALDVSRGLIRAGRRSIVGGNMAPLVDESAATFVYRGILDVRGLDRMMRQVELGPGVIQIQSPAKARVSWIPHYAPLAHYHGKVPLLRLNASHGCLYPCSFCGDAWSRKLHVVEPAALEAEMAQLEAFFPDTNLIYIGDKTFGQSEEAVANLCALFESRPQYSLIVQTHIHTISPRLIETMAMLRVAVVEMGFESADPVMLRQSNKNSATIERHEEIFERLGHYGIRVVLNVLGGLPLETREAHARTVGAMERWKDVVWLYNLYNFVPYPLTPYFPEIRSRIFNWNFAHWREDAPPVFTPFFQTVDESWAAFLEKVEVAHRSIGSDVFPVAPALCKRQ